MIDRPDDPTLDDGPVTEEELAAAAALRELLAGSGTGDAESRGVVGRFRHAAGAPAPDPWSRIRAEAGRRQRRGAWSAAAAFAIAASISLFVWWPGGGPEGPSVEELQRAAAAVDPSFGSTAERLDALNAVAGSARRLLVAEELR